MEPFTFNGNDDEIVVLIAIFEWTIKLDVKRFDEFTLLEKLTLPETKLFSFNFK